MVDLFNCKKGVKFFMKCLFTKVHQFYISPNCITEFAQVD